MLLSHPRGQHLTVFSDSAHALRVVQANSDDPERAAPRRKKRRADADAAKAAAARQKSPALDPRERCLATAIGWLLRLRTAQTCFFKVWRAILRALLR